MHKNLYIISTVLININNDLVINTNIIILFHHKTYKLPDSFLPLYEEACDHSLLWHEVMLVCQATLMQLLGCHNDLLRVMVLRRSRG